MIRPFLVMPLIVLSVGFFAGWGYRVFFVDGQEQIRSSRIDRASPTWAPEQSSYERENCIGGYDSIRLRNNAIDRIGPEVSVEINAPDLIDIATKASQAGGVRVNGVNPIVFWVAVLELALDRGLISKSEGQAVVDAAKCRGK